MTEAEWLACTDPLLLLRCLTGPADGVPGRSGPRKLWLFAVACGWQNRKKKADGRYRHLLKVLGKYADGQEGARELTAAFKAAGYGPDPLARSKLGHDPLSFAFGEAADVTPPSGHHALLASLFRDIFGNPFRPLPTVSAEWLARNDGTVPKLARGIYEERAFDRMPILADALEEAGCEGAEILAHCRQPGEHVRGCWVIDLLTGRG
jgi:hypothetical protein